MTTETKNSQNERLEKVSGKVWRARTQIFFERLWPASFRALGVISIFVLMSLFDIWSLMPGMLHIAILVTLGLALIYFLMKDLAPLEWPRRQDALARLEADSALGHAPLQSLEDTPFRQEDIRNPLWQAHLTRMARLSDGAHLGKPLAAEIEARDPFALRFAIVLLLIFGYVLAQGDVLSRFLRGVSPQMASSIPVTADIWIDPPAYTGKAPVTLLQSGRIPDGNQPQVSAPAGSILNVRISGIRDGWLNGVSLKLQETEKRRKATFDKSDGSMFSEEVLGANTVISLAAGGGKANWPVAVTPDFAPEVTFSELPEISKENRIRMVVDIDDDYGIASAQAVLQLDPDQERPLDAPGLSPAALGQTARIPVTGVTGAHGPRAISLDLTDHRWAGLAVLMRIEVTDGAGNIGETSQEPVTIPERTFYNPLAKAIIHERRNLAVSPSDWMTTSRALDALTFAPDRFFDQPKDYLLLRTAYWNVMTDRGSNTDLTVDQFWPLALQLEDQSLELARRALDVAQEALREALERGAPAGEIASLVEDLRLAMQNYIQALAESGQAQADASQPSEELGANDLNDMLDSINDLTQSGANNAARQLLSDLESMLENLKISQDASSDGATGQKSQQSGPGGQGQPGNGDPSGNGSGADGSQGSGSQAMGAAGELIGRQRELADDTFDALRDQFGIGSAGDGNRSLSDLREDQEALAQDLRDVMDQFNGIEATDEGAEILQDFRDALESMEQAAEALDADNPNAASQAQEEALTALRDGAEGIAEEVMRSQEDAEGGDGTQQGAAETGLAGDNAQVDPLGRPWGILPGEALGIPDLSDPERARELVQELRRRLAEPGRSREEIEYLERLLQRF